MSLLELLKEWDKRTDWESVDLTTGYFFKQEFLHDDDSILDVIRNSAPFRRRVLSIDEDGTPSIAEAILWGDVVEAYQHLLSRYPKDLYLIQIPYYDTMVGSSRSIDEETSQSIQEYLKKQMVERNMKTGDWMKADEVRELASKVGFDKAIETLSKMVEEG